MQLNHQIIFAHPAKIKKTFKNKKTLESICHSREMRLLRRTRELLKNL